MIRAHTLGVIDYSKYRRYDIKWNLREQILLSDVYDGLLIESGKASLQTYTAALCATEPGSPGSKAYHEKVFKLHSSLSNLLMPWIPLQEEADKQDAVKAWRAHEERMKTDEFKAQEANNGKLLNAMIADSVADAKMFEKIEQNRKKNKKVINRKKL